MNVITNAGPEMTHKMVAAYEVGTTEGAARSESLVETDALKTNTTLEFRLGVFAEPGGVDAVKIVEKWTLWRKSAVEVPACSPGQFAADSKLMFQQNVGTEHRISATT